MSRRTTCALGAGGSSLLLVSWAGDLKMLAPFLFLGANKNAKNFWGDCEMKKIKNYVGLFFVLITLFFCNSSIAMILDSSIITVYGSGSINTIGGSGQIDKLLNLPIGSNFGTGTRLRCFFIILSNIKQPVINFRELNSG